MQVDLPYGRGVRSVDLPDERVVRVLAYQDRPPLPDPDAELARALEHPIGTRPLFEMAAACRTACVLICDITRPVPNERMLTAVLERIESAGVPRDGITILIATGLHRPNQGDELVELVGQRIARDYRVENHFAERQREHAFLGTSPRGVPIWIDQRYLNAELKLTIGLIEPHFMAGFSGGRKLICPGIAAVETIRTWHGPDFLEDPRATTGVLVGNPVHEENTWIAQQAGCDMIVDVALDQQRRPLMFVAGDMVQAFQHGVEFVRQAVVDFVPEPVDIVVTTAAGYPLDATFYQTVKGMVGAASIVREGGTIIVQAAIEEGIGSRPFQQIFDDFDSLDAFRQALLDKSYSQVDQWQLEEMAKARDRAEIVVVTDGLDSETLKRLWVNSAPSVEAAVDQALIQHGDSATIAVIPKGPYVIAEVQHARGTPV